MNRRFFLRGLVACPAVVAASSLMPVRGIIMPVRPMFDFADVTWTATGEPPMQFSIGIYNEQTGKFIGWIR